VFQPGSPALKLESGPALNAVVDLLRHKPEITLMRVEVHTDSDGIAEANLALSKQRALAIAQELVARGVDCKRLIAVGFGESRPIAQNDSPENKAKNRRVEFFVATLNRKALQNKPVDGGGKVAGNPCPDGMVGP